MAYRLTGLAEHDIVAIAERGIVMFGESQARRDHEGLFATFDLLAANPLIARERHELDPPVRIHPFNAHIIIYSVEPSGDIIVVRIRHGREDWTSPDP